MQRSKRLAVGLGEVHCWTNWIEYSSNMLSFPQLPQELLVLFVMQSVRLAHSLNCVLGACLPKQVVDEHIRGYLVDRVWSYHLLTERVQREVRERDSRAAQINSEEFRRSTGKIVARIVLRHKAKTDMSAICTMAVLAVLRSLEPSTRNRGAIWTQPASSSSHPDLSTNCTIAGRSERANFSHARAR